MIDARIRLLIAAVLSSIVRNRWIVLGVVWIISLGGWAFVTQLPDEYVVRSRIYVDTDTVLRPLMRGLAVQDDPQKHVDTLRRTLLARPNIEQLMLKTDLDLSAGTDLEREMMVADLQRRIHVGAPERQLYQITYTDADPRLALNVVQALIGIFVEQNVGHARRDVENARRFIDLQIDEHLARLKAAEGNLAEFRREHGIELSARQNAPAQVQQRENELRRLENEMEGSIWRRDQLRNELARTPATISATQAAERAGRPPPLTPTQAQLARMQDELSGMLMTKTDKHPDVVLMRKQIESMKEREREESLAAEAAASSNPDAPARDRVFTSPNPAHAQITRELRRMDVDLMALQQRIKLATEDLQIATRRMLEVPEVEQQLGELNRDYDVIKRNYQELLARREAARMSQQIEDQTKRVDFRLIDPPVMPVRPTAPNRPILFAGVFGVATAIGLAIPILLVFLRPGFLHAEQMREMFDLPVLGSVTIADRRTSRWNNMLEVPVFLGACASLFAVLGGLIYVFEIAGQRPDLVGLASRLVS